MTDLSPRLQPLFEMTKVVCFSQFIVEIPATATVVRGPTDVDSPITYFGGDGNKIGEHVQAQLAEIEKDRILLSKTDIDKFPLFGKIMEGAVPGHKLVFGTKNQVFYSIHSFIPVGADLFVQHISTGVSQGDATSSFSRVAKNLRLRSESEVPAEPGTCIEGGFVALQPEFERASIGVRLKEFPDVHFSISVIKNQKFLIQSRALESRLERAEKDGGSWYPRVKFFRRGQRILGSWKGFEALARKPSQGQSTASHQFAFVSLGAIHDPLQPSLDIQLDTGVQADQTARVEPSITDEETVALWDKLTSSIRVRPTGAAAKHSATRPPTAALGTFIDTGSACPQAGWWQCSDHGEVTGGRRRYFVAEQTMPHASVRGKGTGWQALTGRQPTIQIPTTWQLVEYDPMPIAPSGDQLGDGAQPLAPRQDS